MKERMSEKKNKFQHQKGSMKYWFLKTTFYDFLFSTKKYSELYKTRVALVSLIFSVVSIYLIWIILQNDISGTFLTLLQNLVVGIIAGFMGLLGFVIGGLALVSGTISNESIKYIDSENKSSSLIGLLFSFCFHGGVIVIAISGLMIAYLVSIIPSQIIFETFNNMRLNICYIGAFTGILLTFICYFAVIYSVTLLMTCLRLFLLRHKNSGNCDEK